MTSLNTENKFDGFNGCDENQECLHDPQGDPPERLCSLICEHGSDEDPDQGCAECHRPVILVHATDEGDIEVRRENRKDADNSRDEAKSDGKAPEQKFFGHYFCGMERYPVL